VAQASISPDKPIMTIDRNNMNRFPQHQLSVTAKRDAERVSLVSNELTRESVDMISAPNKLAELRLKVFGTEAQRAARVRLKKELIENAAWVNQELADNAAKAAALAVDCQADALRQQQLIEHRKVMNDLSVAAQDSLVQSLLSVMEQKAELSAKVEKINGDPQMKEFAKQLIDQIHQSCAQNLIDRNQKFTTES
jgi:hypothetical protein